MAYSVKRACDLRTGDRVSLPASLLPSEAYIENVKTLRTINGKPILHVQLKTLGDVPFFIEAAMFNNEKIEYVKPPRQWFKKLNQVLNPFTWTS